MQSSYSAVLARVRLIVVDATNVIYTSHATEQMQLPERDISSREVINVLKHDGQVEKVESGKYEGETRVVMEGVVDERTITVVLVLNQEDKILILTCINKGGVR